GLSMLLDQDRLPSTAGLLSVLELCRRHEYPLLEAQAERALGRAKREPSRLNRSISLFDRSGARPYVARVRCELALITGYHIAVALMGELNAGDHLVAAHDCYGTTLTFVRDDLSRFGITSSIVDFQDLDAVKSAVTDRTRVLLCEMCTNPLIRVPDLEALAGI